MYLSIVIPAYEESKKIARDIQAATAFLENNHFTGQIIIVDDGSKDNTAEAAKNAITNPPAAIELKVERYNRHRGKGYAVRKGIGQTSGEYVMFADSGCCVPYEDTLHGLELIKSGACDIAHGSRKIRGARHLYGECVTDGFAFDIEIIMRAQKEGYRIKEFPIDWTCDRDSRLSPTRSSWRVLSELLTIRRIMAKNKNLSH